MARKSSYINVTVLRPPVAAFTANVTSGIAPLTVFLTDGSTGGTPASWYWDFGDKSNSRHALNATHTFTRAGRYTLSLTVNNAKGSSTAKRTGYITVASK
jgi:PKD repeat protein